jgi:hypothetical protein
MMNVLENIKGIGGLVKSLAILAVVGLLFGCTAHSPFIVKNTTDAEKISDKTYPSHKNKVFITRESLPASVAYEIVAKIDVGKVWYGGHDTVLPSLAARARTLGADAVIQVNTWRQPSGWSWAAPHGSGLAVKFTGNASDVTALKGSYH